MNLLLKLGQARLSHIAGLSSLLLFGQIASPQVSVLTHHNDIARTGQNLNETILTPQNVNSQSFGIVQTWKLDGQVYAQPLYFPKLTLPTSGQHNVVFAATEHDSLYAFDADAGTTLWQATLLDAAHGAAAGATAEQSTCGEVSPELGITGTPVIDPVSKTMWVAAKTTENGLPVYRLHAIDITTGLERANSPVVFQATVTTKTGTLAFDPKYHRQRPGLLLLNGIVYIAFGGICDTTPWHGWIFAYNATTLAKTSVYVNTPDGNGGGIWMAGAGLAAEVPDPVNHPFGRMFIATGNGTYDGLTDYGDGHERFDLSNGVITFSDSFTPSNQAALNSGDLDVASGGLLLLPDQPGAHPHLLVQAGKTGTLYVIDRDNMGGYHPTDGAVQEIPGLGGMFGTPAYWNGNVYYWGKADVLRQYALVNGTLTPTNVGSEIQANGIARYPGGMTLSISANGNTNGIVWTVDWTANIFYAHDATNVSKTLYSLPVTSNVKFTSPTIANGKVYLAGSKKITVFGLLPNQPDFTIAGSPLTLQMAPTASATSTISIAPINSFTGTVNLTIGSLPAGITATLSSSSVTTSGSVTLTVNTTNENAGTFPITITGTGTTGSHSTIVTVSVPAAATPSFSPGAGTYTTVPNVTISDSTTGATIYYTTDGTTPTITSPVYSAPIPVSSSLTLQAIAKSASTALSSVASAAYVINLPQAATPVFSPAAGTYAGSQTVTISDTTVGAVIHYTLDGSTPTATSPVYTSSLQISATTTVKALATATNYSPSAVASATYTINGSASTPTFSPAAGTYTSPVSVTLSDVTPGAAIHYTLDGSTPTAASPVYTAALQLTTTTIVNAIATATGYSNSTVASATYTINGPAATPTLSPASGTYASPVSVTISDTTAGAVIHYTVDGSIPTASSPVYTTALQLTASTTVNAIATATGYANSSVASATYTINGSASAPTFSPAGGIYTAPVSVTLSDVTPGAAIHYTLDGSTPTAASPAYTAALQVTATTTINAIATATGYTNSAVTSATYTINGPAATPTFSPAPGSYGAPVSVTLSDTTPGAAIHYTLDGSNPTATSPVYTAAIQVSATTTIRAVATATNFAPSSIASATYTINGSATPPSFSPLPGTYSSTVSVTLTDTTPGASIHYTRDGSVPTATSPVYTAPLVVAASTTINALATAPGYSNSSVSTGTYAIVVPVTAQPALSPAPGSFTVPQNVTLSDSTAGAVIHYTLDGTTPTVTSPTYTAPLAISATTTVNALAIAPGFSASTVVSGTYTITQAITTAITSPIAGATFTAPANITINATASASTGTITKVEFYSGTTLLGQSLAAPYSYTWLNAPAGSYLLSTIAYGSTGVTASSASVSISVQQQGVTSPTPNGQWNLDAAVAGVTPDATAAHNDATLSGAYSFVAGKIGNSILFNPASGAALTKTSPFNSAGSFSVATWVYLNENTNAQGFICQPAATGSTFYLELGIPVNGKLVFDFDVFPQDSPTAPDSIAVGVTTPLPNTWYHIVGVYDAVNQQASIYVNGALESTVSSYPGFANTGGLAFGYSKWMGGRVEPADGRMDDVRAYGVALTPAQVLALYQGH